MCLSIVVNVASYRSSVTLSSGANEPPPSIGKEHVQRFPITRDLLIDPIDVFHLGYVGLDAHAPLPEPIGGSITVQLSSSL